jgi:hypothetical protein
MLLRDGCCMTRPTANSKTDLAANVAYRAATDLCIG